HHKVSTYFGGHLVHQSTQQQKVRGNSRLRHSGSQRSHDVHLLVPQPECLFSHSWPRFSGAAKRVMRVETGQQQKTCRVQYNRLSWAPRGFLKGNKRLLRAERVGTAFAN
ncbi:hypothetical protein NKJ70_32130, partial [Mesorhizobium sp. M0092]|uniref:hypothetical protein n=1 Tax=Mesorhizobium sp. M0092 TaxID=2956876 RepID=UPI003334C008